MYQLTASYAQPTDPTAFLEHYRTTHVPIARQLPNLRSYQWIVCQTPDGSPPPPHVLIAVLHWDSQQDAMEALGSSTGQQAVADLATFAQAGVDLEFGDVHTEV